MSALSDAVMALESTQPRLAEEGLAAAIAEADHRRLRSKRIVQARAEGTPVGLCEYVADADDTVADAHMKRLTTAAIHDATKQVAIAQRERIGAIRTDIVTERAADQIHATSGVRP